MLQVDDEIAAQGRVAGKKGGARKLRRAGRLPAVAYGPKSAARLLSLDPKDFLLQRRQYGASHIYRVKTEKGEQFRALIKRIDVDALSRRPLHVDLYEVDMSRQIRVEVPIELTGKPAGAIDGGLLTQMMRSCEILVRPDQVPAKIVADVSPLKVGSSLHLSDLKLPAGVKLTAHGDEAVALVSEPDSKAEPAPAAAAAAAPATAGSAGSSGSSGKK